MKNVMHYSVMALSLICLFSCKKSDEVVPITVPIPEKVSNYQDSISFEIDENKYFFGDVYRFGIGNNSVNLKPSPKVIEGEKFAYVSGGSYWYGVKDSTLYSVFYAIQNRRVGNGSNVEISFVKKFRNSQLLQGYTLLFPKDHSDILKLGKSSFAVDYESGNTMDGIVIEFTKSHDDEKLSTRISEFPTLRPSGLTKDIQNNSSFEITKMEQIQGSVYLVEAKFEVNMFDDKEKLHRLKKGFLRIKTNMTWPIDVLGIKTQ